MASGIRRLGERAKAVEQGMRCFNSGRYLHSLDLFRRAMALGERDPQMRCFMAHALNFAGRTEEAVAVFAGLIDECPQYLPAYSGLANMALVGGRLKEAGPPLARVLRLRPRHRRVRRELVGVLRMAARACQSEDQLDAADKYWTRLLRLDPGDREARRELEGLLVKEAQGHKAVGRSAQERRLLGRLLRLNPKRPRLDSVDEPGRGPGLVGGGAVASEGAARFRALASAGRYKEAFAIGERILDGPVTLPDLRAFWHPWDPSRIGSLFPRHIAILTRMAKSRPKAPWTYYYLGALRLDTSLFKPIAASSAKRYGWMRFKVGHTCLMRSDFEQALQWLRRALAYRPIDWRIHGFLAETYLCLGKAGAAFAELDRAKRVVPSDEAAQVLAWRGALNLWRGDYETAIRLLDTACDQGALWAYCWRGGAKIKLGRPADALADLDKAIRIYPGDREAHAWRGEAKRELGRSREALRDLNRRPVLMWALMNRALIKFAHRDYEGMERDYYKISSQVRAYIQKRVGLDSREKLNRDEIRAVLRAGLNMSRGYRHNNIYGNALWMV